MLGYFITGFAGMFWFFRLLVTLMYTSESSFPIAPLDMMFEIVLLFITFVCIIFIAKRKMIGAVTYLIAHCAYFGANAYQSIEKIIEGTSQNVDNVELLISLVAVMIPLFAIMDIGLSNGKGKKDKKTDWFYGTTEYDRNFDERADKNQYKF